MAGKKESIEYNLPFQPNLPQFTLMHKIYHVMKYHYVLWTLEMKMKSLHSDAQLKDELRQMIEKYQEMRLDPTFSDLFERLHVGFRINLICHSKYCNKATMISFLKMCKQCRELDYIGFTIMEPSMIAVLREALQDIEYSKSPGVNQDIYDNGVTNDKNINYSKSNDKNINDNNDKNTNNENTDDKNINASNHLIIENASTIAMPTSQKAIIVNLARITSDIKHLSYLHDFVGFDSHVHFEFSYSELEENTNTFRELFGRSQIPRDLFIWCNGTLDWKATLSPEERSCKLSTLLHQKHHNPRPILSGRFLNRDFNLKREKRKAIFNPSTFVPLFGKNSNDTISQINESVQFCQNISYNSSDSSIISFAKTDPNSNSHIMYPSTQKNIEVRPHESNLLTGQKRKTNDSNDSNELHERKRVKLE